MDQNLFSAALEAFAELLADKVADRVAERLSRPSEPAPAPEFLTAREAAAYLGLTYKGLEGMRYAGRGPKFVKIGGAVRYPRKGLDRYRSL